MAEAANYTVVQQGDVTLPDRSNPNPNSDFVYGAFGAPGLSSSASLTDRPYLQFSVDPAGVCELELELNGTVVVSETFGVGDIRSVTRSSTTGICCPAGTTEGDERQRASFTISDVSRVQSQRLTRDWTASHMQTDLEVLADERHRRWLARLSPTEQLGLVSP